MPYYRAPVGRPIVGVTARRGSLLAARRRCRGHAALVLTSLVPGYAEAERSEESNSWRHPVDLVEILDRAFEQLPGALQAGRARPDGPAPGGSARAGQPATWAGRADLIPVLLGEDAQAIADALLDALRSGATEEDVAGAVAHVAALRIAQFPTSNEFGDWDTALHTSRLRMPCSRG